MTVKKLLKIASSTDMKYSATQYLKDLLEDGAIEKYKGAVYILYCQEVIGYEAMECLLGHATREEWEV